MLFSLIACASPESSILGTWICERYEGEEWTFFDDGTFAARLEGSGDYSIQDNKIKYNFNHSSGTYLRDFEIKGNELTFTDNRGSTRTFTKK